ncbi:MAG: methyl-branched lipid omega-hydroxylase [Streptosporangiaceae bacterium]|nr:methyl-branched lipid omega-hydroxylase [Streptosporangiaceae bacterium]
MALGVEDINLTDWDFWARPLQERHAAFKSLRDRQELAFFQEPDLVILPQGPGYRGCGPVLRPSGRG